MISFSELYDSVDSDFRYLLDERAAIHEFDGKLSRPAAEERAVIELFSPGLLEAVMISHPPEKDEIVF